MLFKFKLLKLNDLNEGDTNFSGLQTADKNNLLDFSKYLMITG